MELTSLDWGIIIGFLVLIVGVGISYTRQASKDMESFFLGGRNMHWLLAGVSMVATTFAADTPLAVAEIVSGDGISGNWLWWNFLAGGMLTTFFFARLWQRSGVLTEVELIELRYAGKPAQFLRGFKAIYLGVLMNVIVIAWVNVALQSLLVVFFGVSEMTALLYTGGAMILAATYASFSGLIGVAVTDAIQFVVAMIGCIALAYFVVNAPEIGGIAGLKEQLESQNPSILNFLPSIGTSESAGTTLGLTVVGFLAYAGCQWWACWYPGAEPGGGGYVAQRMMSTRSDKDAVYATLFFQIAHYCIRPWAWIIVGLAAVVLYPDLASGDEKLGYVYAMRDFLPAGWKGLLLVAFLAAYMSTISTQLNWGAGYLVNDVYKRFWVKDGSSKHYIFISRISTIILMVLGLIISTQIDSISGAWSFIIQAGAGLGLVLILRWYWWRINVWSEISATLAPFFFTGLVWWYEYESGTEIDFPIVLIVTTLFTTCVWLLITFMTKPEPDSTLIPFWKKVHGVENGNYKNNSGKFSRNLKYLAACWLSAIVMTYSILFLTGKLLLQEYGTGFSLILLAMLSMYFLNYFMNKAGLIGKDDDDENSLFLENILDAGDDSPMDIADKTDDSTELEIEPKKEDKKEPPVNPNIDFPDMGDLD
jgi:Na+/proline symporter